ncbi:lysophospholipid acyltransferase family protein [Aliiglaciecola sp. LCG003]|uniref:lysophospholipid acyltransferase family protein n=1 Tax=Aliiglaciecola sp. LCG003 TaxID=3053655 RepID=UPI0025724137|nr:lysophospholipid acyltransferase family protein [Aliiglaciecola sp. LCG003]WJG08491.1 lysophospholipid acyltransferase family protein [Aliiglaciecola sp. LCG003]
MYTAEEFLKKHYPQTEGRPWLFKSIRFILRHLLHEKEMLAFGRDYPNLQGIDFIEQVLEYFNVSYSARDSEKERIPSDGRVVVIANHPIGSLDALALMKLLCEVRSDVKVVANEMLMALPPLHDIILRVNNMQGGTPKEHLQNIHQHLNNQGAILIFPAGEVSRLRPQGIRDTRWHSGFLKIAKATNSPILPAYIDAKNSPLFYSVSMFYKPMATALLVKEMFKQRRKHLPIRIGEIIPVDSYIQNKFPPTHQVKMFKKHLYRIGHGKQGIYKTQTAIALPEDRKTLSKAIKQQCERLGETGDGKHIYLYRHTGSSPIMREIGRLREFAFRAVGEGSNKRRDVDNFDSDYFHLLLWDNEDLEIAGAYRFGDTKQIIANKGLSGLYSATLFEYTDQMAPYFEQGLELGRSFVQPRYWGKRSLDYLWYGIGAFLNKHPQYRYLFGPVSLSNNYHCAAKVLLVQFYSLYFPAKTKLAYAKLPFKIPQDTCSPFLGADYKQDFTVLKHSLANMGAVVPTLFKQYSETYEDGGLQFIEFNIDPDFNQCIDGLAMGDITMMKAKKRQRYLQTPLQTAG